MSEGLYIASLVEGHGEAEAVPVLMRRILSESEAGAYAECNPPIRLPAGKFFKQGPDFIKMVTLAKNKVRQELKAGRHRRGLVLAIYDCEDTCPATTGPAALAAMQAVGGTDIDCLVILAYREYETWFLAAAESLRGACGLSATLPAYPAPESIRDAKGRLSQGMTGTAAYSPTEHQAELTKKMDFAAARTVASFARLERKLIAAANAPR